MTREKRIGGVKRRIKKALILTGALGALNFGTPKLAERYVNSTAGQEQVSQYITQISENMGGHVGDYLRQAYAQGEITFHVSNDISGGAIGIANTASKADKNPILYGRYKDENFVGMGLEKDAQGNYKLGVSRLIINSKFFEDADSYAQTKIKNAESDTIGHRLREIINKIKK